MRAIPWFYDAINENCAVGAVFSRRKTERVRIAFSYPKIKSSKEQKFFGGRL